MRQTIVALELFFDTLGKWEYKISHIHRIMGCFPDTGHSTSPRSELLVFKSQDFLTPRDHSGGREKLNAQGLPED